MRFNSISSTPINLMPTLMLPSYMKGTIFHKGDPDGKTDHYAMCPHLLRVSLAPDFSATAYDVYKRLIELLVEICPSCATLKRRAEFQRHYLDPAYDPGY